MNYNRALNLLAKFFSVGADVFSEALSRKTIIHWAESVKAATVENLGDQFKLTQPQHAFLIGQIRTF
jgi:hypothetical protein